MTSQMVVEIIRNTLMTTFWVSLPLLAVGFVAGIVISLVQIVTSIQDPGFGSVPRLAAFLGAILIFMPWMLIKLISFTTALLGDLGRYARCSSHSAALFFSSGPRARVEHLCFSADADDAPGARDSEDRTGVDAFLCPFPFLAEGNGSSSGDRHAGSLDLP